MPVTVFPKGPFFSFGGFEVDAELQQRHVLRRMLTDNPVEDGSVITDHTALLPREFDMLGFVTDTRANADVEIGRSKAAFQDLKALLNGDPADLVTGLELIANMVMVSLNVQITAATGASLTFRSLWRELLTAETQFTELPPDAPAAADKNKVLPSQDSGRQATEPPNDEEVSNNTSILAGLLGVGG